MRILIDTWEQRKAGEHQREERGQPQRWQQTLGWNPWLNDPHPAPGTPPGGLRAPQGYAALRNRFHGCKAYRKKTPVTTVYIHATRVALSVLLFLAPSALARAQDGEAIYKQRCASCHDGPTGRAPSVSAIKQMTAEAVAAAMMSGPMKSQASGLSTQQIFSLIVYIAPQGRANTKPA